jgi:hypothetical protein
MFIEKFLAIHGAFYYNNKAVCFEGDLCPNGYVTRLS